MRLTELLLRARALYADAPAVYDADRDWTWGEVLDAAEATAGWLAANGVQPGDRVALVGTNRGGWLAGLLGCWRGGAVPVALNARAPRGERDALATRAGVRAVLHEADLSSSLDLPAATLAQAAACRLPPPPWPEGAEDADAIVLFTSGTTGQPKGVRLTHRNLLAGHIAWRSTLPLAPGEAVLQLTPPWHAGAVITLVGLLAQGATAVLRDGFAPGEVLGLLRRHDVVCALMVPAMIAWVLREPGCRDAAFPRLRLLVYAGAPMPQELLADARATFGCRFAQGYGLTETAAVLTLLAPEDHDHPERLGSVGRVVLGARLRVVGADGGPVPDGVPGEVEAAGDVVSPGALDDSDRPPGSWLATGDLGVLAPGGWLTLLGRSRDLVIVAGENVHPREVEAALEPLVDGVACLGLPHALLGEELVALVVASDRSLAAARRLQQAARARLERHKVPTRVRFVDALPITATGKLDRTALRSAWDAAADPS